MQWASIFAPAYGSFSRQGLAARSRRIDINERIEPRI